MIRSEKKLTELATKLSKENKIEISETIRLLRKEQPFEGAVGLLTSFYNQTDDIDIRKSIEGFMNDVKDHATSSEVIREIRKQWKPSTITMLVSSCWQSGLDYAGYAADLAVIFLKGDYATAVECFTVIEESVDELSLERKAEIIKIIEDCLFDMPNEKRVLAMALLSILGR